jgi:hypothetical protein
MSQVAVTFYAKATGIEGHQDFSFQYSGYHSDDAIAECTNCGWIKRKKQKETPWGLNDQISG